ncbi:hypothetical protein EVJ58_g4230 [Rhodofomes roseus]|uniref:Uncharacterized protein n=1 Tax=Rhodofomes roseus TaxID=34475 RepID=A0A4Y9YHQ1_9APHY|nr:hypothetical protein EVJ58_g4230 [Rhodofomes roseus]
MHFCPRITCRRWYHQICLLHWNKIDSSAVTHLADRGVRLLAVDPDDGQSCPLLAYYTDGSESNMMQVDDDEHPDVCSESDHQSNSGPGIPISAPEPSTPYPLDFVLAEMSRSDVIADLPPALICISQCPIVRRPGPAQDGWTPAGNVKEVVLARRLVYAAFEPDESINDNWSALDPQECCDRIGVSFRYATPYPPYWQRREKELETETWMYQPPVICPNCNAAI